MVATANASQYGIIVAEFDGRNAAKDARVNSTIMQAGLVPSAHVHIPLNKIYLKPELDLNYFPFRVPWPTPDWKIRRSAWGVGGKKYAARVAALRQKWSSP